MTGVNLLDVMDLAGALCNMYLSFILPILAYIIYYSRHETKKISTMSKIFHGGIMAVFCAISLVTIGFATYDLAKSSHTAKGHVELIMNL